MQYITAKDGQTWDYIALQATGQEFDMDLLINANKYALYDVITFADGDVVSIPDEVVQTAASVQSAFSIIESPWG